MLARHVSDLIGPSSGAFVYKLYSQTLVCGTTVRTTRHVQPLRSNTSCILLDCIYIYISQDDKRSLQYQSNFVYRQSKTLDGPLTLEKH